MSEQRTKQPGESTFDAILPVILGVIPSRLIDENWRRAVISEQESLPVFFVKMVSSPLLLVLFPVVDFIVISPTPVWSAVHRLVGRRAN